MDQSGELLTAAKEALRDESDGGAVELVLRAVVGGAATPPSPQALEELGDALVLRGIAASEAVRMALACARALQAHGDEVQRLDDDAFDALVVALARAVEEGRRRRRQAWLSFLVHELKNPLNTVVNALWLLKEKGAVGGPGTRFLELADRAVKRLETRVKDVRELDDALLKAPPGWEPRAS